MNEFPYRDDADKSNDMIKKFHKSITAVSNPIFLANFSHDALGNQLSEKCNILTFDQGISAKKRGPTGL